MKNCNYKFKINFAFCIAILNFAFLILNLPAAQAAGNIGLFWHANTLVPENYQGKALPIRGSMVTVTAIAQENYKNLNYSWYLDRTYIKYSSGIGKNSFSFRVTEWPGFSHNIQVKVGEEYASLSIKVAEPEVYLGRKQYIMRPGESKTFIAYPYYFTSSNLEYNWAFNNKKAEGTGGANPEIFTLDIASGYPLLERKLDVTVTNPNNFLERAMKRVLIKIE